MLMFPKKVVELIRSQRLIVQVVETAGAKK